MLKYVQTKRSEEGPSNKSVKKWELLSGSNHWTKLLDPLDIDLRRYIIRYGEMAQVTYDTFIREPCSKYAGASHYNKKNLFRKGGLEFGDNNPYPYTVTKYLYATSIVPCSNLLVKSLSREAWNRESNWIGYVAVATDKAKANSVGRRDVVIAWRGTIRPFEWFNDFNVDHVSASAILGVNHNPQVHSGWLSIYTSNNPKSRFNKDSVRDQVLGEVNRLVQQYNNEEMSITVVGHSLGGALATLNATDISVNVKLNTGCLITVFAFACPKLGDHGFKSVVSKQENLRILRIRNKWDMVPKCPPILSYNEVGKQLTINTTKSPYLLEVPNLLNLEHYKNFFQDTKLGFMAEIHNLEVYLHGVAGTQGSIGGFKLVIQRDISLVNKRLKYLKDEYEIPSSWLIFNKGMVQQPDGTWKMMDREPDDGDDDF